MIDFLRWLIAAEIVGLAWLPLTMWVFRWLPDRGYAFAKILGLLLLTYVTWLIGNAFPVVASPVIPLALLVAVAGGGWVLWRDDVVRAFHEHRSVIVFEESLFVLTLLVWTLLRVQVFHAAVSHTEQFMDLSFLTASMHSASYPPYDPWMSGHVINYYYFGYLMMATLAKIGFTAAPVAYNLALSFLLAAVVSGAFSIGYALSRRLWWSLLAPVLVALVGNWHALLWQLPHRGCSTAPPITFWNFLWEASRVIGANFTFSNWACPAQPVPSPPTINEFPLFSFVLGDMHPHVMALPVTILGIALAANVLLSQSAWSLWQRDDVLRGLVMAIGIGSLYAINSWDFPTYLLVVASALFIHAYIVDDRRTWWQQPAVSTVALAVASVVVFSPFYLRLSSPAHGLGTVSTPSDLFEFIQVFGLFLLTMSLLAGVLNALLRPAEADEETREERAPVIDIAGSAGQARIDRGLVEVFVLALAIIVIGGILRRWVLLADLGLCWWLLTVLHKVVNSENPNRADAAALGLGAIACLVLAGTEVVYLRDAFDGGSAYRMNTIFKFYYQAWTLLALTGAYGVYRAWSVLSTYFRPVYAWGAMALAAVGVAGAGVYTFYLGNYGDVSTGPPTLDASAWWGTGPTAHPADLAAIQWLRDHAKTNQVEMESVGGDYTDWARISTFTGLPTVMGWAGHEDQWRPGDPEVGQRVTDIQTVYTTHDPAVARSILRRYGVHYVVLGGLEQTKYGRTSGSVLPKLMHVAAGFRIGSDSTTIYTW